MSWVASEGLVNWIGRSGADCRPIPAPEQRPFTSADTTAQWHSLSFSAAAADESSMLARPFACFVVVDQ